MSEFTLHSLPSAARDWLIGSPLGKHADLYTRSLKDEGYAAGTIYVYLGSVSHFAHWLSERHARLRDIDERLIGTFLDRHLPGMSLRASLPAHAPYGSRGTSAICRVTAHARAYFSREIS